ncbi:MAG: RNase adapter RapZ [Ruminococcus sp.]|nr:RNase adapter RapZ [Ruminococcus sp.]
MDFLIITGLSGAGKSTALKTMEDIGYYCVDNIPATLLHVFYDLCEKSSDPLMKKVAVVIDVRNGESFEYIMSEIHILRKENKNLKIAFLDAKDDVLITRFKETRRHHPLYDKVEDGSTKTALQLERESLSFLKKSADYLIDTTYMSNKQLAERIYNIFLEKNSDSLIITFMSFGFKYGLPLEADLVFDARCLPNPYYIPELKPLTGLDLSVRDYVLNSENTQDFMKKILDFLDYAVPLYQKEGKSEIVVAIGCTGGKHRSVTLARSFNNHFIQKGYKSTIQHRDIWKM